jgi:hypothetical protein
MIRSWGRRHEPAVADMRRVREAVGELVESGQRDAWFADLPDEMLLALVAPLEMLTFQYYLDPPRDRLLVRAAKVACAAMDEHLGACPAGLAGPFSRLSAALTMREPT